MATKTRTFMRAATPAEGWAAFVLGHGQRRPFGWLPNFPHPPHGDQPIQAASTGSAESLESLESRVELKPAEP